MGLEELLLQQLATDVREFRKEAREDHRQQMEKLDSVTIIVSDHSTRIKVLEVSAAARRWFVRMSVAGLVTFVFDLVVNHVSHWWPKH